MSFIHLLWIMVSDWFVNCTWGAKFDSSKLKLLEEVNLIVSELLLAQGELKSVGTQFIQHA